MFEIPELYHDFSKRGDIHRIGTNTDIRTIMFILNVDFYRTGCIHMDLCNACSEGDLNKVKACIKKGANIHIFYDLPLRRATAIGSIDVVSYLLECGANLHEPTANNYRISALSIAIRYGHTAVAKILISKATNKFHLGFLLSYTITHKLLDFAECIINTGLVSETKLTSALFWFSHFRFDGNLIRLCIKRGANIHYRDGYALSCLCARGDFELAKFLIENGANVRAKNNKALRLAIIHYRKEYKNRITPNAKLALIKLLLDHGADVNTNDGYALKKVFIYDDVCLLQLLVKYDLKVDDTHIRKAIEKRNVDILYYLLTKRENLNTSYLDEDDDNIIFSKFNQDALHYCCFALDIPRTLIHEELTEDRLYDSRIWRNIKSYI